MAAVGEEARSSRPVIRDLRLVHRRVWHQRPARGEGAAGRVGGGTIVDFDALPDQAIALL